MLFFLNQQFITQCAKADYGSYFCNYIQKKHTNRKIGREKRERTKTEMKRRTNRRGMRKEKPRSTY